MAIKVVVIVDPDEGDVVNVVYAKSLKKWIKDEAEDILSGGDDLSLSDAIAMVKDSFIFKRYTIK